MEMFLKFNNGKFYNKNKKGSKALSDEDILQEVLLRDEDLSIKAARQELIELKEVARKVSNDGEEDTDNLIEAIILEAQPLKNFFIVSVIGSNTLVYYRSTELVKGVNITSIHGVCTLGAFDNPRFALEYLCKYEADLLQTLYIKLSPFSGKKRLANVSLEDTVTTIINTTHPQLTLPRIKLDNDPQTVGLEGLCEFALSTIPYKKQDVVFTDLAKTMQSFLSRVEHHQYLCAIIWSHLIGNMLPYVNYMRGFGGDGKTGFILYLGQLTKSFASFDANTTFNYYNMFGKAIISIEENTTTHLMQNKVLKSITGGNLVQIEGKNKDAFTSQIRGLLFVDSNYDLECANTADERRRLRFFRVKPIVDLDNNTMSLQMYLNDLKTTNNEFLNYCRQCFDILEVKNSGGLIQKTPNHDSVFESMRDLVQDSVFADFYKKYVEPKYEICKDSECDMTDILINLTKQFSKDKFAKNNFKQWLRSEHNVLCDGRLFLGMKEKKQQSIDEVMPQC